MVMALAMAMAGVVAMALAMAMVIGRLGFLNKSDKVVIDVSGSEERPTLEARGQSVTLKKKSLLWFKSKFRVCTRDKTCQKQPGLTAPCLATG